MIHYELTPQERTQIDCPRCVDRKHLVATRERDEVVRGTARFATLNAALESEGLLDLWPLGVNVEYNSTVQMSAGGRWISVTRFNDGHYERPVHYKTRMPSTYGDDT